MLQVIASLPNHVWTVINIILTAFSIGGAIGSCRYSKRSKTIDKYYNIHLAIIEVEKMQKKLLELYYDGGKGFNRDIAIRSIGNELAESYQKVRKYIPVGYSSKLDKLESQSGFELLTYFQSCLNGKILINNEIDDNEFRLCQKMLMTVQEFLKKELNVQSEKLK